MTHTLIVHVLNIKGSLGVSSGNNCCQMGYTCDIVSSYDVNVCLYTNDVVQEALSLAAELASHGITATKASDYCNNKASSLRKGSRDL